MRQICSCSPAIGYILYSELKYFNIAGHDLFSFSFNEMTPIRIFTDRTVLETPFFEESKKTNVNLYKKINRCRFKFGEFHHIYEHLRSIERSKNAIDWVIYTFNIL